MPGLLFNYIYKLKSLFHDMGFIRGGLLVIVSVLFFISLLVSNSLLVATFSLDYDNIKQDLIPVVEDALSSNSNITSAIENIRYPIMQAYCRNAADDMQYVFDEANYTFSVPCSVLSNGSDAVLDYAISNFIHEQYYAEYGCSYWQCFKEGEVPFFLVSQYSHDYWQSKFYLSIAASLALLALMLLLIEKKTNLPFVAGALVIISSLIFAKLEFVANWIAGLMVKSPSPASMGNFFKFFTLIFIQSYNVFLIMLIIGIALLALGVILKFFAIGFRVEEFFSKFSVKKDEAEEKMPKQKDGGQKQKTSNSKKKK
jgi:hypothetical protein